MTRAIASFLAAFLLFLSNPLQLHADSWSSIATTLAKSVVYIETTEGSCTGMVINAEKDYVLTAAHCDGTKMYADHSVAEVVAKDTTKDMLVVHVKDLKRPALQLALANAKVGDEVVSYGYGYGLERPMLRVTHVADDKTDIPYEGIGGPLMVYDTTFVPGMSGGPVVNAMGMIIGIVQRGTDSVGLGFGAEMIREKMGKYFELK